MARIRRRQLHWRPARAIGRAFGFLRREGKALLRTDVIVLGAGIVGVSTALHLQKRGRSVVLVDRRGAGEETSHGNAGIIQREGVVPYPFPRDLVLVAKYALNLLPESNLHWSALPKIAPWLWRYWRASTPERVAQTARAMRPLIERCILEHEALMADAGILGMVRRTGYMRVYRSGAALEKALAKERADREAYGVNFEALDAARVAALEPHLKGAVTGGVLMPDPVSVGDPGAVVKAYARLLQERGGRFLAGDARSLQERPGGWAVETAAGRVEASAVVVALGPWADDVLRPLGYRFPLGVKRGYHRHFKPEGNATLERPVLDAERGLVLAPMAAGIRLTTSVEFALRDAPPSPVQLERAVPSAREIFPLGPPLDRDVWLGRRPCLPDMLPVIGAAPGRAGLWLNFGHHHLGFTLGPVTGRLLAELVARETPFTDPGPYRAERF
jgi:D-amino-acid dehydrogenase